MPPRETRIEIDDLFTLCGCESRVALGEIGIGHRGTDNERKRIKLMGALDLRFRFGYSPRIEQVKTVPVMCGRIIRIQRDRALELILGLFQLPKIIIDVTQ